MAYAGTHGLEFLLMPGGHCALAEPHGEGHTEGENSARADDDEPAEALGEWGGTSKEGAAAIVGAAVIGLVSVARNIITADMQKHLKGQPSREHNDAYFGALQ